MRLSPNLTDSFLFQALLMPTPVRNKSPPLAVDGQVKISCELVILKQRVERKFIIQKSIKSPTQWRNQEKHSYNLNKRVFQLK
jgi:hypothetical protein